MNHSFNIEIATFLGLKEAIIFENILHWIAHNMSNNKNLIDGEYWTFNTYKAFQEIFPYLTYKQIRDAIDNLVNENLIKKSNFNKKGYDNTNWYALDTNGYSYLTSALQGRSTCPTGQTTCPTGQTNTIYKPNIKQDINNIDLSKDKSKSTEVDIVVEAYHSICTSYPKLRKLSSKRIKQIKAILKKYTIEEIKEAFEISEKSDFMKGINNRNWSADFDWILNDTNLTKILEGKYSTKEKAKDTQLRNMTDRALQREKDIAYIKNSEAYIKDVERKTKSNFEKTNEMFEQAEILKKQLGIGGKNDGTTSKHIDTHNQGLLPNFKDT